MGEVELHARDILNLADVKAEARHLFMLRKAMGWSVKGMEDVGGHSHGYLSRMFTEDRYPWDWYWSTMCGLCEPLGANPYIEVTGFELPETPMYLLGQKVHTLRAVGVLEALRAYRIAQGVTAIELGSRIGLGSSAVAKLEGADDPRLGTIMKLVRGLGGEAKYKIREM